MAKFFSALVLTFAIVCVDGWLSEEILNDIQGQKKDVDEIINYFLNGKGKGETYKKLAEFTDDFGPRVTGSNVLEDSIDHMYDRFKTLYENVKKEEVDIPHWERGTEWAAMVSPRYLHMDIMSVGTSVGTQNSTNGTLRAEVIVVSSFEELEAMDRTEVEDKIVVYNQGWVDYSHGYVYRNQGAAKAAEKGAVAALLRSVTGYSLYTPHTGAQKYGNSTKIPCACLTVEDTELLARLQARGKKIELELHMEAENYPAKKSNNLVAEKIGSVNPEQVVVVSGHIDSWDVGHGVMDDAGGVVISWQVLEALKDLDLKPKRTIRLILWTAEEQGLIGSQQYFDAHKNESENMVLVMESDSGTFNPRGIGFTGSGMARAILEEAMSMLDRVSATGVGKDGSAPDTGEWEKIGVPVANLWNDNQDYFHYHHTHADTLTLADSDVLDRCAAVWAASSYIVANLKDPLPREGDYPESSRASHTQFTVYYILISLAIWLLNH